MFLFISISTISPSLVKVCFGWTRQTLHQSFAKGGGEEFLAVGEELFVGSRPVSWKIKDVNPPH